MISTGGGGGGGNMFSHLSQQDIYNQGMTIRSRGLDLSPWLARGNAATSSYNDMMEKMTGRRPRQEIGNLMPSAAINQALSRIVPALTASASIQGAISLRQLKAEENINLNISRLYSVISRNVTGPNPHAVIPGVVTASIANRTPPAGYSWGGGGRGGAGGGVPPGGWGNFNYGSPPPPAPPPTGGGRWGAGFTAYGLSGRGGALMQDFSIADIIWNLIDLPQDVNRLEQKALGASAPFMDFKERAFNLARGAGMGGGAFAKTFFPGYGGQLNKGFLQAPESMSLLGLTPEMAFSSLEKFGGVRPDINPLGLATAMRQLRLSVPYVNMPEGTIEQFSRWGSGLGLNEVGSSSVKNNPIAAPIAFANVMQAAFARSMDQARVLQNIQAATETTARSGAGAIDSAAIADVFTRMMVSNAPLARTGDMASSFVQGVGKQWSNVLTNPMSSMAAMNILAGAGDLSKEENLQKLFGGKNTLDQLRKDPWSAELLKQLPALQKTSPGLAIWAYGQLATANPTALADQVSKVAPNFNLGGGGSSVTKAMIIASILGVTPQQAFDMIAGRGHKIPNADLDPKTGLPKDVYEARVSASMANLVATQYEFDLFASNLKKLNELLEDLILTLDLGQGAQVKHVGRGLSNIVNPSGGEITPRTTSELIGGGLFNILHPNAAAGPPTKGDPRGMTRVLIKAALDAGVDPVAVMAIARREGLGAKYASWDVNGISYGALQMHQLGGGPKDYMRHGGGMANAYWEATHKDPSDPANEADMDRWAIMWASKHGWGPWSAVSTGRAIIPRHLSPEEVEQYRQKYASIIGSGDTGVGTIGGTTEAVKTFGDTIQAVTGVLGTLGNVLHAVTSAATHMTHPGGGSSSHDVFNPYSYHVGSPGMDYRFVPVNPHKTGP